MAVRVPKFLWDLNMIPEPDGDTFKALYWYPDGTMAWRTPTALVDGGTAAAVYDIDTVLDGGGA